MKLPVVPAASTKLRAAVTFETAVTRSRDGSRIIL